MGTFGHKIFEPLVTISKATSTEPSSIGEEVMLFLKTSKANATGRITNEGFVVFKGGIVSATPTKSCPENIQHLREQFAERIDINNVLLEDTLFKSPSAAAGFITYASANGLIMWMTSDGTTLKDIESKDS